MFVRLNYMIFFFLAMAMDAALLHMDPKSPEAQVFYQLGGSSNQSAVGSPASSPSGNITY